MRSSDRQVRSDDRQVESDVSVVHRPYRLALHQYVPFAAFPWQWWPVVQSPAEGRVGPPGRFGLLNPARPGSGLRRGVRAKEQCGGTSLVQRDAEELIMKYLLLDRVQLLFDAALNNLRTELKEFQLQVGGQLLECGLFPGRAPARCAIQNGADGIANLHDCHQQIALFRRQIWEDKVHLQTEHNVDVMVDQVRQRRRGARRTLNQSAHCSGGIFRRRDQQFQRLGIFRLLADEAMDTHSGRPVTAVWRYSLIHMIQIDHYWG